MAQPDRLLREIRRLEQSIESLESYLCEAELYPPQGTRVGRLRRAARLFVIRRAANRQLRHLRHQYQALLNCQRHSTKS